MTARKDDFRATTLIFNSQDVATNAIANIVIFALNALTVRHDSFEFAEINHHVVALEAADGSGNNVAGTVFKFLINHFLLRLAKALHHRLLGSLDSNTTEIFGGDVEFQHSADFNFWVLFLSNTERNFIEFVHLIAICDHIECCENLGIALFSVNFSPQSFNRIGSRNHFTISRNKRKLERRNDLIAVDSFFFFVIFDECDDVVGHG